MNVTRMWMGNLQYFIGYTRLLYSVNYVVRIYTFLTQIIFLLFYSFISFYKRPHPFLVMWTLCMHMDDNWLITFHHTTQFGAFQRRLKSSPTPYYEELPGRFTSNSRCYVLSTFRRFRSQAWLHRPTVISALQQHYSVTKKLHLSKKTC